MKTTRITCDAVGCTQVLQLRDGDRASDWGWGIVRLHDGWREPNSIGDQNGWNNFDLCRPHYRAILTIVDREPVSAPTDDPA